MVLRQAIADGLIQDPRLDEIGIDIVGVRVLAVRPSKDLELALQTPVAEHLQQEADGARFERRATAVEQERAISENELHNEIGLARRAEELVGQKGLNERKRMSESAEADRIRIEAAARDARVRAAAKADAIKVVGVANGEAERAKLDAYAALSDATILGLAVKDLAGSLPDISTLVITPDLLTSLVGRFGPGEFPATESPVVVNESPAIAGSVETEGDEAK